MICKPFTDFGPILARILLGNFKNFVSADKKWLVKVRLLRAIHRRHIIGSDHDYHSLIGTQRYSNVQLTSLALDGR